MKKIIIVIAIVAAIATTLIGTSAFILNTESKEVTTITSMAFQDDSYTW